MTVTVKIHTDNATFEHDPSMEVARILAAAARKVEVQDIPRPGARNAILLHDINGNQVGTITAGRGKR